jgi:hypothetical protein
MVRPAAAIVPPGFIPEALQSLLFQPQGELVRRHGLRAGGAREADGVGRVVVMAVCQEHQVELAHAPRVRGTHRVRLEPGIDDDTLARGGAKKKRGMAEEGEGELHRVIA